MATTDEFEARAKALKDLAEELEVVVNRLGTRTALTVDTRRSFRRRLDTLICDAKEAAARVDEIVRMEREGALK